MKNKQLGSILLIAGTAIGAVTLALPISMINLGFMGTMILYTVCWLFMYLSSLILSEVCFSQQSGTNFVSLSELTMGQVGKCLSWCSYGLLLITLLMAYFSGLSTLINFNNIFFDQNIVGTTLVALMVWLILIMGTEFIDALNRLMIYVLSTIICIMLFVLSFRIEWSNWLIAPINFHEMFYLLPLVITGFGFQVVLPSIRGYLDKDKTSINRVVLIGSILPLVLYVIWTTGLLTGLDQVEISDIISHQDDALALKVLLHDIMNKAIVNCFVFAAIVSSLLGVSLSLADFLSDAFKRSLDWRLAGLTVFVPWLLVNLVPAAFVEILRFGGLFVAILLILIPCVMLLILRKQKKIKHRIAPNNIIVACVLIFSFVVILTEFVY
ncbi:MAG: aromatic amino acid transport family protein [Pseudomonadota bacterium]|nr:aromatic amino acid transport family protein [Pseudomonadota bacterium]